MQTRSEGSRQSTVESREGTERSVASAAAKQAAADAALCRAALYSALALGFQPPTAETLERLAEADAATALADAARHLADADTLAAARALARPGLRLDELVAAHRRLFGHTARGEVPPYETEYGGEALFQQPQELSDLAGFMRAFGLVVRPAAHERVDHVSCECEFLSFLACKEAYAIDHGDEAMRAATVRATSLFLRDHLGRFAAAFARRLGRADPGGFYRALGTLLAALVQADGQRLQVALGAASLTLRPDPSACAVPMGCGDGEVEGCPALRDTP